METFIATGAVAAAPQHAATIRVSLADTRGWIVTVVRDGRVVTTEHHTDWHRVERRVAVLESGVISDFELLAGLTLAQWRERFSPVDTNRPQ